MDPDRLAAIRERFAAVDSMTPQEAVWALHEARSELDGSTDEIERLEGLMWDRAQAILREHPELDWPDGGMPWTQSSDELRRLYDAEITSSVPTINMSEPLSPEAGQELIEWAKTQIDGPLDAAKVLEFAQRWEEIADSHGDPVRYGEADVLWHWGFDLATQQHGEDQAHEMMGRYGWTGPDRDSLVDPSLTFAENVQAIGERDAELRVVRDEQEHERRRQESMRQHPHHRGPDLGR